MDGLRDSDGFGGMRREALVEAASIAGALDNHRAGRGPARRPADDGFDPPGAVSGTLEAEADWLAQVSVAFSRLRSLTPAHAETDH